MKLAGLIYAAIQKALAKGINPGKTTLQKIIFFSLQEEARGQLYRPYFYGPYSKSVQIVTDRLIQTGYIDYNEDKSRFELKKDIETSRINADKTTLERIFITVDYLAQENLCTAQEIAFLSKVFFFDKSKPQETEDFYSFIKQKSKMYEWAELVKANQSKIDQNLALTHKLEERLDERATV